MNESTSTPETVTSSPTIAQRSLSPWRCLSGAIISGGLTTVLYFLTASIAQAFAAKPIHSNNPMVLNIAVAVRTLVVGISTLGTGIFGLVSIGLVALAIQLSIQQVVKRTPPAA